MSWMGYIASIIFEDKRVNALRRNQEKNTDV